MSTKTKWYGLTVLEKLPKGFWGIVLEDAASQADSLLVSRYVNGVREPIYEVTLSNIIDNLCCLEEVESHSSDFLRKFLILSSKGKLRRSEKIHTTSEVQDLIVEDYCSIWGKSSFSDEFPDETSDEFLDDFPDDFPDDFEDNFPDDD